MSTTSKAQASPAPLKSGKGMSGTNPDDSATKPGAGGGNAPKPDDGHAPRSGKGKRGLQG
jgi:hypothetical protein